MSFVVIGGLVWGAFNVRLGAFTLAQHLDRIGQTREAEDLIDGTRSVLRPAIEEATDRLLGEYIEAPTSSSPATSSEIPTSAGPPPIHAPVEAGPEEADAERPGAARPAACTGEPGCGSNG